MKPDGQTANRDHQPRAAMVLAVVLLAGVLLTLFQVRQRRAWMREEFLDRAARTAQGVHTVPVEGLAGDDRDLDSPSYGRLKSYLARVRRDQPDIRFVYLLRRDVDGKVIILADSEAVESPDYSPPGDVYPDAVQSLDDAFDANHGMVIGPVSDRWGVWVTALVPVMGDHGRAIALFGMDTSAADWSRRVWLGAWPALLLTAALAAVVLFGGWLLHRAGPVDGPARNPLFDHAETVVVVAVGLLVTAYAAFAAHQGERRGWVRALRQLADIELGRLTYRLETVREYRLPAVAGLFESGFDVPPQVFHDVVRPLRGQDRPHAWGWVAAVPAAGREAFERRLHGEYERPIPLWEMDAGGRVVPAGIREMYYPLHFVSPMTAHGSAVGFDLGSEPRRKAALAEAARLRLPVATEPIRLVSEPRDDASILILYPVYCPRNALTLRGFAIAALSIPALGESLSPTAPLMCRIYQLREGAAPVLLASAGSAHRRAEALTVLSRYANAYGHVYKFTVRPNEVFFRAHRPQAAGLAAGAGLMSTLALALLVGRPIHRRRRLERQVEARTRALREKQAEQEVLLRSEETARRVLAGVVENQKETRRELMVRDQLLSAAAEAAQVLIAAPDITDAVTRALAAIGKATGQDRAYVFVRHADTKTGGEAVSQRFEWVREGVTPQRDNPALQAVPLRHVCPRWADLFDQGQCVHGAVADFPSGEREILEPQGVVSLLVVPVFVGGSFWGFVGLDNCREVRLWSVGEQAVLNAVAASIGTAVARHEAVAAMRASEARFHALIEHMDHIPVQGYDESRRVIFWNAASEDVYGYPKEEALGRRIEDLIIPDAMRGQVVGRHAAWLKEGQPPTTGEYLLRDKQGRNVPVYSSHILHVSETGRREVFCVDVDLRRLRAAEERLRQTHKMESIGRLAGGIAHDFNNILMVQLGYCDMLANALDAEHPCAAEVHEIRASAERAVALTKQLLAFSRKQPMELRRVDLGEMVCRVEAMLIRLIGTQVRLSVTCAGPLWSVRADAGQLEQVVMNLAVNARDAMPDGGELHIDVRNVELSAAEAARYTAAHAGPYVSLRVKDTGTGMDEETLQQLFEPFFTTKDVGRGTGLGLSIVYGIVTQSGGGIRVESRMGDGTLFDIVFPREDRAAASEGPPPDQDTRVSGVESAAAESGGTTSG